MWVFIAASSTKFNWDKPQAFSKTSAAKPDVRCLQGEEARSFLQGVTRHGLCISFQTVQLKRLEEHTGSLCSSLRSEMGWNKTPLSFPYQFLMIFYHQEGSIVQSAEALTGVPVGFTLWEVVAFPLEIQPTWWTEFQGRMDRKVFGWRMVYCEKTKKQSTYFFQLEKVSGAFKLAFWLHHLISSKCNHSVITSAQKKVLLETNYTHWLLHPYGCWHTFKMMIRGRLVEVAEKMIITYPPITLLQLKHLWQQWFLEVLLPCRWISSFVYYSVIFWGIEIGCKEQSSICYLFYCTWINTNSEVINLNARSTVSWALPNCN